MNTRRSFFKSLPVLACFGIKTPAPALVPPVREFLWWERDTVVGLWAQSWDYDRKTWSEPYLIVSEFDEDKDNPFQGQHINNMRRNKYWGKSLLGDKLELLCFDRWETGIRFFQNNPNTDWSLAYPIRS